MGADQPQQIALLRADQVLTTFAAGEREVGRAHVAAARVIGQNGGVLVVGMGGYHQNAAHSIELLQRLFNCRSTFEGGLCARRHDYQRGKKQNAELGR